MESLKTDFSLRSLEALGRPPGAGRSSLAPAGGPAFAELLTKDREQNTPDRSIEASPERGDAERQDTQLRERPTSGRNEEPEHEAQRPEQPAEREEAARRPATEPARERSEVPAKAEATPSRERPVDVASARSASAQTENDQDDDAAVAAGSAAPDAREDALPVEDEFADSSEFTPLVTASLAPTREPAAEDVQPLVAASQAALDRPLATNDGEGVDGRLPETQQPLRGETAPTTGSAPEWGAAPTNFGEQGSQPAAEQPAFGEHQIEQPLSQPQTAQQPQANAAGLAPAELASVVRPSETEDAGPFTATPLDRERVQNRAAQPGAAEAATVSSGARPDAGLEQLSGDDTLPAAAPEGDAALAEQPVGDDVVSGARGLSSEVPSTREGAAQERTSAPVRSNEAPPAPTLPGAAPADSAPVVEPAAAVPASAPEARVAAPSGPAEGSANTSNVNASAVQDGAPAPRPQAATPTAAPRPMQVDSAALERADTILSQVRLRLKPGMKRASLTLRPESLGRISISLSVEGGRMSAAVRAESPETLAALERHVPELRALMAQANLDVQEFSLTLVEDGTSFDFADEGPETGQHDGAAEGGDSQPEQSDAAHRADLRNLLASTLR